MTFQSVVRQVAAVATFPQFMARQHYMLPINSVRPELPADLECYGDVVEAMLKAVSADTTVYLTVDEKLLVAGATQRRPRAHIDGIWVPSLGDHTTDPMHMMPYSQMTKAEREAYRNQRGAHREPGGHIIPLHAGHRIPSPSPEPDRYRIPHAPRHRTVRLSGGGLILASNAVGCRYWTGEFTGDPGAGGDLEHIRSQLDAAATNVMAANHAYVCNVWGVHESIPVTETVERQLVRISLPESIVVH